MKKFLLALTGAAVLWAGIALADYNVINQGSYYKNAQTGANTDASGNALVTEAYPAMDANLTFRNVVQNVALTSGSADSNSAVLDTHRMRLGMLLIKCVGTTGLSGLDSTNTKTMRLAIQVRTHLDGNTDSLSTFAVYPYGSTGQGVTAGASPDSATVGHLKMGGKGVSADEAWSGEMVVVFTAGRQAYVTGGVAIGRGTYYYPNGIAVPLQSLFGRDIYSPYTSIRVRNLTQPTVNVTVHLVGTPL